MDWFINFLKGIREQSPYYNMTFAVVSFFVLFLPIFFSVSTLEKIPEIIVWRQKYLPYIAIAFVVFFVFGGGQFIKRVVDYKREKKELLKLKKEKQSLLSKLEDLYTQSQEKFKDQYDCIQWSNKVAPLLKFNNQYYTNFVANAHHTNIEGLSGTHYKSCVNQMKSQVKMAIEELKNDLG